MEKDIQNLKNTVKAFCKKYNCGVEVEATPLGVRPDRTAIDYHVTVVVKS